MRVHRLSLLACAAIVLAIALPPRNLSAATEDAPASFAVIVAATSKVNEISHALLRRIFLGEPAEHAGVSFVPLNYPPSDPLRIAFDRAALGFSPDAAGRYWVDRRIRGQGLPPRSVPSPTLLRAVVARLPGAIGYLAPQLLTPEVRALRIDGVSYDDPDYPSDDD